MFARWNFTVWSATQRISATWRFERPPETSCRISSSRRVSLASSWLSVVGAGRSCGARQENGRLERLPDRCRDPVRVGRLQHVRSRAALERGVDHTAISGPREHDHGQLRAPVAPGRDHPQGSLVALREIDLHHEQVGLVLLQERLGRSRRRRCTDQVDVEASQQRRERGVTQRMWVERDCLSAWSIERFVVHRSSKPSSRTSALSFDTTHSRPWIFRPADGGIVEGAIRVERWEELR